MDNFLSLFFIALGLSADAFAVAVTNGIIIKNIRFKDALKIGGYFGFFQAFMPIIGWTAGVNFREYIVKIDHWVAFGLLAFIGIRMIIEAVKEEECEDDCNKKYDNPLSTKTLLTLAVATSIDALAVGVGFAFLNVNIISSALTIGIITFALSALGVLIGKKCGTLLRQRAQIVGGIILVLIGFKILLEHLNILTLF